MIFRQIMDKDFDQIAIMYEEYTIWQESVGGEPNPKLTSQEMQDVYYKLKKGSQAENYDLTKKAELPDHFGWVADNNSEIVAYYEWGGHLSGRLSDGTCGCYISVFKDGFAKEAEELLVYTFKELKKIGFKKALGHISKRMASNPKYSFFGKYAEKMVSEAENAEDMQYQRDL